MLEEFIENGADIDDIRGAAMKIAEARPMMASVFRLANDLLFNLEDMQSVDGALRFIERFVEEMEVSAQRVTDQASQLVAESGTVMTHSFSSLVKETVLKSLESNPSLRIICTESRPKNEGVKFAQALCEAGAETILVTDAAAGYMCKRADMLLLGADGIGSFGLVHKTGSYPLSLVAKENGIPTVVLAGREKIWPFKLERVVEPPKPAGEIAEKGCFERVNLYFDTTPLKFIDRVVTEIGILDRNRIEALSKETPLHPLLASE
ncbi:ribose-1,5-bisphosphate isomerase [Hydrogenimonas sp.]|nr:ribose-1,5-bisphosphate isomerase [Hydrogenimonas sp.]